MYILKEQLQGLPGAVRKQLEEKITTYIVNMINTLDAKKVDANVVNLTLVKEVCNIKAVINLARTLHQPQDSENQQSPADLD